MTYQEQLQDPRWKELADRIKKRDAYQCQLCFSGSGIQAHHKQYISGRMAWEYEEQYLITLCDTHHKLFHGIPEQGTAHESTPEDDFYRERWKFVYESMVSIMKLDQIIAAKHQRTQDEKRTHENG